MSSVHHSDEPQSQWSVTRRGPRCEPICFLIIVDGIRLQVYRHVARPEAWTAYAYGLVSDVVLVARDLTEAQVEALAILKHSLSRSAQGP